MTIKRACVSGATTRGLSLPSATMSGWGDRIITCTALTATIVVNQSSDLAWMTKISRKVSRMQSRYRKGFLR